MLRHLKEEILNDVRSFWADKMTEAPYNSFPKILKLGPILGGMNGLYLSAIRHVWS